MRRLASFVLLTPFVLIGCAANTLQGSLSSTVPLAFDSVTIQTAADEISVSYLQSIPGSSGQDIVLEIVASTDGLDLAKGGTLTLTDTLSDGTMRGTITRLVHNDSRTQFPPITHGTLTFDSNPTVGAKVSGSFSVLFGQGGELGAGQTVFGTFDSKVVAAPAS